MRSFLKPIFSACMHCGKRVPFWINLPVLSYLLLLGRTRCCKKRLSFQYPLVELCGGFFLVFLFYNFPFLSWGVSGYNLQFEELMRFTHAFTFTSFLLVGSVIDLKYMIIPDRISLTLIITSPLAVYLHPSLSFYSSLLGAFLGGASIYLIAWTYILIRKKEGIGMGDAKLLAGIGGWLGWQSLWPTLMYASVIGSVIGLLIVLVDKKFNLQKEIPFGPFLSLGATLYLLAPFSWRECVMFLHNLFS